MRDSDEPQDFLEDDLRPARSSFLERIRASAQVLRGHRLVPAQIHAEWIEYQQLLDDLLKRLSAQLARQARSEKARVQKLLAEQQAQLELEPATRPSAVRHDRKSELRRRYASQVGLHAPSSAVRALELPPPPPSPEEEAP